jgi:hypothetical protein
MTANKKNTPNTWIDPNDAPELFGEDFGRGIWASGDKVVSREKAQEAIKKVKRGRPQGTGQKKSTTISSTTTSRRLQSHRQGLAEPHEYCPQRLVEGT